MTLLWTVHTQLIHGYLLYDDQNLLMVGVIYHCGAYFNLLSIVFLKFRAHWMISFVVITVVQGNCK
jgi:hypothetical protein